MQVRDQLWPRWRREVIFKAAPGVDPHVAAHRVEAAYLPHGLQAIVIAEELDDGLGPKQALSYVLEGFMSLTLLMGVVALGLIAGRAVVERRHTVGMMRARNRIGAQAQVALLLPAGKQSAKLGDQLDRRHLRAGDGNETGDGLLRGSWHQVSSIHAEFQQRIPAPRV